MDSLPSRKTIRLKNYDYSGTGGYYVTLCVQDRRHLLGEVIETDYSVGADPGVCPSPTGRSSTGEHTGSPLRMSLDGSPVKIQLTPAGEMIEKWWSKIPEKFPGVECNAFVVMPNHVHFIVINTTGKAQGEHIGCNVGADPSVCPNEQQPGTHTGAPLLGTIIQWFKTMTTNEYIHGVNDCEWPRFEGRLWQRNYWERIIRENEWDLIRGYIHNNPVNWASDRLNNR